jgi:hypothetical protein
LAFTYPIERKKDHCLRSGVALRAVRDEERDAAVKAHLEALDAEIARLRKLEGAMDRKLEEREAERAAAAEQLAREEPNGSQSQ